MKMNKHGGDIYRNRNVIDFSSNCNPFGAPEGVKKAIADSVEKIGNYPDTECTELRKAISAYEEVQREYILCGNGAADLIFAAASAVKPAKALVTAPAFAEYSQALTASGCSIKEYFLKEENGFEVKEDILEYITEDIDMMFLCNPNNPTGVVTEKELLLSILKKCREKNVILVLDECFNDFISCPSTYTMKDCLKEYDNLIILKAFTKKYAVAGLRLGYAITGNRGIIDKMKAVMQPWGVSVPAQEAGIAALKEEEYVKKSMEYLSKEKDFLKDSISEVGFKVYGSEANYIFFKGTDDLYDYCLERGILIRDCSNYDGLEKGYYRVAVKLHEDNMKLIRLMKDRKGE